MGILLGVVSFLLATGLSLGFTVIFMTPLTVTVQPRGGHHAIVVSIGGALGLRDAAGAVRGRGRAHGLATWNAKV